MMTTNTKRALDAAVSELKRDGFRVLLIMFDTKSDESLPLGSAMEILCSETNDPRFLQAMALSALQQLSAAPEDARVKSN